jgi:hypothetical protein
MSRPWPYGAAAAVVGALVLMVSLVLPGAGPASAAPPCAVTYSLNPWTGGFTAQVTVTNNAAPVTSWTLTWTFAGDQKITSAWNAQVAQAGQAVTARDGGYNGALATGGSTTFGFQDLNGTPTPDVDRQWLSRANWRPRLTDLCLGWESYGGARDTLWFDDVAVGSSRIGC